MNSHFYEPYLYDFDLLVEISELHKTRYSATKIKCVLFVLEHCKDLNCPPYSKCMLSGSGEPYCACRDVSKCPREYKRYCDQDKKDYKNLCVLKAEVCMANKTVRITDASNCGTYFFEDLFIF